jgi:hypothetical protein
VISSSRGTASVTKQRLLDGPGSSAASMVICTVVSLAETSSVTGSSPKSTS